MGNHSPDGRFDTSDLDEVRGLHWVFPDDPYRALPPEMFMREYYEPRLLTRLLNPRNGRLEDEFSPVRPLQDLNRGQPGVEVVGVSESNERDWAEVTVRVWAATYSTESGRKWATEAYDLHLFRDGRLVGQCPEPKEGAERRRKGTTRRRGSVGVTPHGWSGAGTQGRLRTRTGRRRCDSR